MFIPVPHAPYIVLIDLIFVITISVDDILIEKIH